MYVYLEKKIELYIIQFWACLQIRDNSPYISVSQVRFRIRRHVLVEVLVLQSIPRGFPFSPNFNF